MKLKKIHIRNFLSIGDVEINFDDFKALTLIEGINDDSSTASSNGAGKSSIFEAIFWGLYGKTKRGLTGDSVINEKAGKDCEVKIWFDDYILTRGRNVTFLSLERDGVDLTKGATKDTQDLLESIIGMSELTFSKIALFGQGDVKDFAALTDAELKQIFEQSLGLGFFAEKLQKAKEEKNKLLIQQNNMMQEAQNVFREIEFTKDKTETLKRAQAEMREQRETMLVSLGTEMLDMINSNKVKKKELDDKEQAIAKAAKELEKAAEAMKIVSEQRSSVSKELDLARSRQMLIAHDIKQATSDLTRNMTDLQNLPQACNQCNRPYDKESMEASANVIANRIREAKLKLDKAKAIGEEASTTTKALEAKLGSVEATFATLSQAQSHLAALNVERTHLAMMRKDIEAATNRINYLDSQIQSLKTQNGNGSSEIDALNDKAQEMLKKYQELKMEISNVEHDIEILKSLEEILGNGGLKSYIFDNITPELNRVISEYMNILNPSINIEISTISKLKSGEYRDKFSVAVDTDNGAAEYKGNSAGERQLINLAISLGFNSLCRTISQSSVNILFLDEPFESLDETASEKAVELCKLFASSIDSPFIISHNQGIKDLVANKLTVRKSGGKAVIVS